jgi:CRP-like cAMP-binding protein
MSCLLYAQALFWVYTRAMPEPDLQQRLQPWLDRWSLDAVDRLEGWLDALSVRRLEADEFLLHAGDRSDTLYLLECGLVRYFYTTPDGRERNKAFYREGQVIGPVSAAMLSSPAPFSIQCLEATQVLGFRFPDLLSATEGNPDVARLYRELLAEAFIRNEQREAMLLTCNAEERYQWLLDNEAYLLERVPQFQLASYLGMDAVSLSRLKRKIRG